MLSPLISWYLFLAGVAGGAFLVALCGKVIAVVHGGETATEFSRATKAGFLIAPPVLAASLLALVGDLGAPSNLIYAFSSPLQSIVSFGACSLAIFGCVSVLFAIAGFSRATMPRGLFAVLAVCGFASAGSVVVYTGVLLAGMGGVAFWETPTLPVLFVASSLSTGLAAISLVDEVCWAGHSLARRRKAPKGSRRAFRLAAFAFALCEAVALALFAISALASSRASQFAFDLMVNGEYAIAFIVGVCGVGLVLPCAIRLFSRSHFGMGASVACSMATLAGGFLLRYVIVQAGLLSSPLEGIFI